MTGYIFCMVAVLLFSFLLLWAYRRGLKDGLRLKDNKPLEPIKTPVKVVSEAREAKQAKADSDKITQGLVNILNFDGNPQKEDK